MAPCGAVKLVQTVFDAKLFNFNLLLTLLVCLCSFHFLLARVSVCVSVMFVLLPHAVLWVSAAVWV